MQTYNFVFGTIILYHVVMYKFYLHILIRNVNGPMKNITTELFSGWILWIGFCKVDQNLHRCIYGMRIYTWIVTVIYFYIFEICVTKFFSNAHYLMFIIVIIARKKKKSQKKTKPRLSLVGWIRRILVNWFIDNIIWIYIHRTW